MPKSILTKFLAQMTGLGGQGAGQLHSSVVYIIFIDSCKVALKPFPMAEG